MAYKIDKTYSDVYKPYIPLSSILLQSYNHDYRNHIRYLGENFPSIGNILERQNYREGRSYSYRLRPFYQNVQLEPYLITDRFLSRKLKSNSLKDVPIEIRKNCNFLVNCFDSELLTIDFQKALDLNSDELEEKGNLKKYFVNAFKILKIKNGEYHMSLNPLTDGRFHSNITGFPKQFRKFLKYNGEKLAEIDISTSVPTFLYYFLQNYKSNSSSHIKNIIKDKEYYNHYMLVKDSVSLDNIEIHSFGNKILNGLLYRDFQLKLQEFHALEDTYHDWQFNEYFFPQLSDANCSKTLRIRDLTLREAKSALLSMLNAKNGTFNLEEISFKDSFPTILKFVKSFKKGNHLNFSRLMLQMESYFMLNIIARRLSNKFKKKLPFFTLHDCIVVVESKIDVVYDFMEGTFETELGFIPVMKIKTWD
ncbi:hypothetical protein [Flavobacterium sp. ASV13]|uniref:hypothetical protein n=1 Tax=Flavobacterium sp. ASV13 TaxID=1506583 RepID=UPI001268AB8F|nr:hypothetical protein [Flavobacterium sp. ASV13]